MLPVYLSDMLAVEERVPNIWQFFLDGHASVQMNQTPRAAKSVDHAGKQENKKLKIHGGLIELIKLRKISHLQKKDNKFHNAMNQNKVIIQSKYIKCLTLTFDNVKLQIKRIQIFTTVRIWAPLKKSKRNEKQQHYKVSVCHRRQITSTRAEL